MGKKTDRLLLATLGKTSDFQDNEEGGERSAEGEMIWDERTQGFVLASFFYGYATTQILGGRLAELYGTRWVFGTCILAGGICTILSPIAARTHYSILIALRITQGIFQVI
ncbi:uncharacterized transporter slc-17.2-like [Penaeus monodon]|uniref:uncharacterized transporter slc-17.2-like n=1 Tax=Penaeus monodon TaxID=6687 RepID=UPI0018A7A088|nr:uncharacterized transporter slc-17.2-like [Penaeus monodon]